VRRSIGAATSPNRIFVLDYRSLTDASEIGALGSVLFSTLSGKLYAVGGHVNGAREYHRELLRACERSDGTSQIFLGNGRVSGAGNGKIISSPTRSFPTTARPSIPTTRHTFS